MNSEPEETDPYLEVKKQEKNNQEGELSWNLREQRRAPISGFFTLPKLITDRFGLMNTGLRICGKKRKYHQLFSPQNKKPLIF